MLNRTNKKLSSNIDGVICVQCNASDPFHSNTHLSELSERYPLLIPKFVNYVAKYDLFRGDLLGSVFMLDTEDGNTIAALFSRKEYDSLIDVDVLSDCVSVITETAVDELYFVSDGSSDDIKAIEEVLENMKIPGNLIIS